MSYNRSRLFIHLFVIILIIIPGCIKQHDTSSLRESFVTPPDSAKPRVYWWWLYNRIDRESITRDLEEFRLKGISGVNLICTGGYAGQAPLPGVDFLSTKWRELFRHAVSEAKRLNIEIGFNMAGGWTMMGPWVTPDNAMKKIVYSELKLSGPKKYSGKLPQPVIVDGYYKDIWVQAFRIKDDGDKTITGPLTDLTGKLKSDGQLDWDVPEGKWVILRTGYTLTGHQWSRWYAYPKGDTFEGGDGYEIDYLSTTALEDHFSHLGQLVIDETRKAGGNLAYLWSDSWECGKLTWTQDFPKQFLRFRNYELNPFIPVLAGYTVTDSLVSSRFLDDFDRTIQDCIADNYYGRFAELCHQNGMKVGNEAGGPNDIPPQDVLKNLGRCDIPAGEFWVHYNAPDKYNPNRFLRLNLKQTATAAHIYGKKEAMAESFTQMEYDRTHWSMGPSDLKPYANQAFCDGINRIMLHQSTCQPPSDGKPGYEFCAGQHFTPNITWWEQSTAFFTWLSRCQFMLQQGKFVADVCFYLGERPPALVPPKYLVPSLGQGFDCDYSNTEVLLTRMSVRDGRITLPDGMSYRLLVLQNCTSPSAEICREVGNYQKLNVSDVPYTGMSIEVIEKIRDLVRDGATVVGPPPEMAAGLDNYPACDEKVRKIASEVWGDLDGRTRTERNYGKGRVIWGKTPREILLNDGIKPDFTYSAQDSLPDQFDYIHRTCGNAEIYFVINRNKIRRTTYFTFRSTGKQPEIWDPVKGEMRDAAAFSQKDGYTTLPLEMEEFGSCFIIFDRNISTQAKGKTENNFPELKDLAVLHSPWIVEFDPSWGGPEEAVFDTLESWTRNTDDRIRYYSGKATYKKTFDLKNKPDKRIFLDLGSLSHVAEVRLNGRNLGILWCSPWRLEITGDVRASDNLLEVDVINLWANRVIGDLKLTKEKRLTVTHDIFRFDEIRKETPLIESGLFGPVRLSIVQ
ncbi:MAG: glycosyl hydrolase [Bacteroidales bacterium]|nr:glycosyl hydrolase [Bacteroidales bacterium]